MAKGIVRTDNLQSTVTGNIKSARFYVGANPTKIENGNIVVVDGLISSTNRELFKAVAPSAITAKNVYLVATPEIIYDETLKSNGVLGNFENAAGSNITLMGLEAGDIFSVSDECITAISSEPVVGNYVIIEANKTKMKEVATLGGTEGFVCKIIARELFKKDVYLNVLQVISN